MKLKDVPFVIIIGFILILLAIFGGQNIDLENWELFLTVIGLTFGLIAAFKINQVTKKFSGVINGIAEETSSLYNLVFLNNSRFKPIKISIANKYPFLREVTYEML